MILAMLLATCLYLGENETQLTHSKDRKIEQCKIDIQLQRMITPKMDVTLSHEEMDQIRAILWNKPGTINVITKFITKIDYIPEKCCFIITFDFTKTK